MDLSKRVGVGGKKILQESTGSYVLGGDAGFLKTLTYATEGSALLRPVIDFVLRGGAAQGIQEISGGNTGIGDRKGKIRDIGLIAGIDFTRLFG